MAKKYNNPNCKTCIYRAAPNAVNKCDYILIMKHSRGCPPEECDKYKQGARLKYENFGTFTMI